MPPVAIENPILNAAFREPTRHFKFDDDGITDEVIDERRPSSYFVPIPAAKKRGGQQAFETEWTQDRVEENEFINRVRDRVSLWRQGGYQYVTPTTRRLLEYWTDAERERPLFFCQVEAMETAIYLTEAAVKAGDQWITNQLREESDRANPGLLRVAQKMATGTGKTVVMAMLIAWHTLNKQASPQDARFTDCFLVVTPGITIRDRLRVLLPSDPNNYYRERDLIPPDLVEQLQRAQIVITNFHAFQLRERQSGNAARLTKQLAAGTEAGPFLESPAQMVNRVCREFRTKKNIVVLNDEAHHCYRHKIEEEDEEPKLKGDDRREAEARERDARVWLTGLDHVNERLGIKTVYDLSATPFFLRGSGYPEGTLFPWVASDFSLIDAIESGIVKIPRVPVSDDAMRASGVTYRDLWGRIADELPKKSRKEAGVDDGTGPKLPVALEGALTSLYGHYEKAYERWAEQVDDAVDGSMPPVFIVVCNNTAVSKLVFDYVAGWEKTLPDGSVVAVPGALERFSNVDGDQWRARPNTILIDSQQLESGDAMSREFKKIAAVQIEEFKAEYRERFPGRDAEQLTDEDLLREVMNTVGKPGKLGEHVKCVVSVSMLTEGWDANTVTHILGVRRFGTQLLCEQVVGRGLRRRSYVVDDEGHFQPEYAEIYGVPFSFIPAAGTETIDKPGPIPTRVRALDDRLACEISFPHVVGYRYELSGERLTAKFKADSRLTISSADVPTKVENAPIVGETAVHTLDELRGVREQEVAFRLAARLVERHLLDADGMSQPWLFPQALDIVNDWMAKYVRFKDDCFPQMLLFHKFADDAADRIYQAIVRNRDEGVRLYPTLRPYDPIGSTRGVDFDTTRSVYPTDPERCHVSHVVADSNWEHKMTQSLEDMPEVLAYVKNDHLGCVIPYTIDAEQRSYYPDFIVRIDDGRGPDHPLNLVVEVSGSGRRDKAAKVATSKNFWVPAVNAHGGFGRWDFIEIRDPWDAKRAIRAHIGTEKVTA